MMVVGHRVSVYMFWCVSSLYKAPTQQSKKNAPHTTHDDDDSTARCVCPSSVRRVFAFCARARALSFSMIFNLESLSSAKVTTPTTPHTHTDGPHTHRHTAPAARYIVHAVCCCVLLLGCTTVNIGTYVHVPAPRVSS